MLYGVFAHALAKHGEHERARANAELAALSRDQAEAKRTAAQGLVRFHLGHKDADAAFALLDADDDGGSTIEIPRFVEDAAIGLARAGAAKLAWRYLARIPQTGVEHALGAWLVKNGRYDDAIAIVDASASWGWRTWVWQLMPLVAHAARKSGDEASAQRALDACLAACTNDDERRGQVKLLAQLQGEAARPVVDEAYRAVVEPAPPRSLGLTSSADDIAAALYALGDVERALIALSKLDQPRWEALHLMLLGEHTRALQVAETKREAMAHTLANVAARTGDRDMLARAIARSATLDDISRPYAVRNAAEAALKLRDMSAFATALQLLSPAERVSALLAPIGAYLDANDFAGAATLVKRIKPGAWACKHALPVLAAAIDRAAGRVAGYA